MNIDREFLLNTPLIVFGLFIIAYWVYGRIKRKPLLGDYKPGMPGYDNFIKFINNNWYLVAAVAITLLSTAKFVTDTITILNGPYSKAILIIAPVVSVTTFFLTLWVGLSLLGKRRK